MSLDYFSAMHLNNYLFYTCIYVVAYLTFRGRKEIGNIASYLISRM